MPHRRPSGGRVEERSPERMRLLPLAVRPSRQSLYTCGNWG